MSERNYYVICDNNCKFPAMTKEQILAAIEQAISTGEITDVDTGFVTKLKEGNRNAALSFWIGTQAEYNALAETTPNCFYIITNDETAEDIDAAIKEMKEEINELNSCKGRTLFPGGTLAVGDIVTGISNYNTIVAHVGSRKFGFFCGYVVLCDYLGDGTFRGTGMFFDNIRTEAGRCDVRLSVDKASDTITGLNCSPYGSSVADDAGDMEIIELHGVA